LPARRRPEPSPKASVIQPLPEALPETETGSDPGGHLVFDLNPGYRCRSEIRRNPLFSGAFPAAGAALRGKRDTEGQLAKKILILAANNDYLGWA
jgi:hypothetical protein